MSNMTEQVDATQEEGRVLSVQGALNVGDRFFCAVCGMVLELIADEDPECSHFQCCRQEMYREMASR